MPLTAVAGAAVMSLMPDASLGAWSDPKTGSLLFRTCATVIPGGTDADNNQVIKPEAGAA